MGKYNICDNDSPCRHKGIFEESYIDQLISLYNSVSSDIVMPTEDRDRILEIIIMLEILLEKYSA